MCLYPKLIKNKKYTANKKNGGIIPPVLDERVLYVPVGCEKCIECRKQKGREWQIRLLEDIKHNKNGKFITLTFSDKSIAKIIKECKLEELKGYELDNEIATKGIRLFLERYRKKHKQSLRHWLVTELGHTGTENIHLHGIVWPKSLEEWESINSIWQYGYVWKGKGKQQENYVSGKTVNYIVKYITKIDEDHKEYKSKMLTSSGIGGKYMKRSDHKKNKYNGEKTIETYRTDTGHKIAMPNYWRNKIYTEEEREKLWLQRLDKNERWVCGEKVAADDTENYEKLRDWHRERSKRLGYGDDTKNWNRIQYENYRRNILNAKRIKNAKKAT